MMTTKTPTKQTSKRGFCLPQTITYTLRTGTKPGALEVSHRRCEPRLTTCLVGTLTHRALCILRFGGEDEYRLA